MKKILVLVLSYDKNPWKQIEEYGIRKTWAKNNKNIFFYYGGSNKDNIIEDKIYLNINEDIMNIGLKTLMCFDMIKDFNFDYIFRTNTSSYVDINLLYKFIEDKPTSNFYCGVIGNHNGIIFCSGSGYFLSKDLLLNVLKNREKWDHSYIDDVSLGKLINSFKNINIYEGKRYDIINDNIEIPTNYYHYRCKDEKNRMNDIIRMKKIHKLKYGEN